MIFDLKIFSKKEKARIFLLRFGRGDDLIRKLPPLMSSVNDELSLSACMAITQPHGEEGDGMEACNTTAHVL